MNMKTRRSEKQTLLVLLKYKGSCCAMNCEFCYYGKHSAVWAVKLAMLQCGFLKYGTGLLPNVVSADHSGGPFTKEAYEEVYNKVIELCVKQVGSAEMLEVLI